MSYRIIRERGQIIRGVYENGVYRILNTNNDILNPGWFGSLSRAKLKLEELKQWRKGNKSKAGRARTRQHNTSVVAQYHKNKHK